MIFHTGLFVIRGELIGVKMAMLDSSLARTRVVSLASEFREVELIIFMFSLNSGLKDEVVYVSNTLGVNLKP